MCRRHLRPLAKADLRMAGVRAVKGVGRKYKALGRKYTDLCMAGLRAVKGVVPILGWAEIVELDRHTLATQTDTPKER